MTENNKMTEVLDKILLIHNPECLKTIYNTAFDRMRTLNNIQAQTATASWKVGDTVQLKSEYRHKKPYGTIGTIKKINKVKMHVDFGDYSSYNVPKTMLVKTS